MSFEKVLVTGAAGFIGSHTVDRLLQKGATVAGVDDLSTGHLVNLEAAQQTGKFEFHEGDISAEGVIAGIVEKFQPQAIVHLAALVSVPAGEEDPTKNFRLNVLATQQVAEAARIHGVKRIVFASSAATYGNATQLPLDETVDTVPTVTVRNIFSNLASLCDHPHVRHTGRTGSV